MMLNEHKDLNALDEYCASLAGKVPDHLIGRYRELYSAKIALSSPDVDKQKIRESLDLANKEKWPPAMGYHSFGRTIIALWGTLCELLYDDPDFL